MMMVEMLLVVLATTLADHDRVGRRIVVMIVCGDPFRLPIQYLPHHQLLLLMRKLFPSTAGTSTRRRRRTLQHVSSDLVLQDKHLLHFLRTVRLGNTEHRLLSLDVRLPGRVVDDLVLDDLGGVALEDLHLHGLVGDHQVAHRMLVVLVLLLLLLLLGLLLRLLLLQLVLLLGGLLLRLLLGLLLRLLLGLLLLLLLDQGFLVGLLDHNKLLSLLLLLGGRAATTPALVLLQMLTLVQHQVVLLEERLTALAHVRPHGAASVRVASVVQQQPVLGGEALAAVATVVGLGLGLRHHYGLLVLLDLLLDLLGLLLLLLLLNHLNLVGLLLLHLVVLNLLLLGWALRLDGLLNHLAGGGDYLYLVHGREQMAGDGRGQRAQVRHQALVAGVQPQVKRQRFPAVEGTATLAARVLWPRRRLRRALAGRDGRDDVAGVDVLHLLLLLVVLLNLLHLDVLLLGLLLRLLLGLLLGLLLSLLLGGLLGGGLLLSCLLGGGLLLGLLLLLLLGVCRDHGVGGDDGRVGRVRVDAAVR